MQHNEFQALEGQDAGILGINTDSTLSWSMVRRQCLHTIGLCNNLQTKMHLISYGTPVSTFAPRYATMNKSTNSKYTFK